MGHSVLISTGFLGKEAQMTVNEGQIRNYSTFPREVELAVIESTGDGMETVHAISQSRLKDGAAFPFPGFTLRIDRHFEGDLHSRMRFERSNQ